MRRVLTICVVLAALVLAVYWPARQYDFLCYDDPHYVTDEPNVKAGLTWPSIRYALTSCVVGNWHPVTTLSHILDCQIFGVDPGPMHLVNAAFHAANALLLFLVLRRMTGAIWRSAIVAAFFALHPLRVESVAWISERKDVLSAFFFLLTLLAYAKYGLESKVQSPRSKVPTPKSEVTNHASRIIHRVSRFTFHVSTYYLLSLLFFALGLMSKPMLVTLPFVLLLLDFWPLQRLRLETQDSRLKTLVREKVPFFALAAIFSVLTLWVQTHAGAAVINAGFTLADRVANVPVSYVRYLGKMFWPADLAAIYPHPASRYYLRDQWPGWEVCAATLLLLAISALCLLQARRRPYLAVGWFWYLGMLVPVIGLIQAGEQAMADRYTYLPLIGPVMSLVWLLSELARSRTKEVSSKARQRLKVRQSSGAFEQPRCLPERQRIGALQALSDDSAISGKNTIPAAQRALAALAVILLALCSVLTRRQLHYWRNTAVLFEHTVDVTADNPDAQFAWGVGLEKEGQLGRAMVCYRVATAICPAYAEAHYNLGQLLRKRDAWREAVQEYLAAIHTNPRCLPAYLNLARILLASGQTRQAVEQFGEALRIEPDSTEALNNLAWVLAANYDPAVRNGARAVEYAERACQLTQFKQTTIVGTLAAAYAEAGRFEDAIATAGKACALAARNGDPAFLEKNRQLLELYRAGKPYHEPGR